MKLKQVIADTALPLGSTDAGKNWCTKALHPADVVIPVAIPDEQARPHAFLGFCGQFKISAPADLHDTDSWDHDGIATPDMINFATVVSQKSGVLAEPLMRRENLASEQTNRMLNTQITGEGITPEAAYQAKLTTVLNNISEARLAYYGVTLEMQAPSLADQGVVVCSQYDLPDDMFSAAGVNSATNSTFALKPIAVTRLKKMPTFASMMSIPGSYNGKMRDGMYAPLKQSPECLHFTNVRSTVESHIDWNASENTDVDDALNFTKTTSVSSPIGCCRDFTFARPDGTYPAGSVYIADERLPRLTNRVIHWCVRGLSPQASLYLTVRCGYEVTCTPGSIYSPYLSLPPPPDYAAVQAYFAVARQLADAYPGDYNSLGALLPVIAQVAMDTLPKVLPAFKEIWGHLKDAISGGRAAYAKAKVKH